MSASINPDIITDGLVLCLDAGNSASYPGSGTVWNDLSGNGNNGTLTNGPTFSSANKGSIVFDGTNDYVNTTFNSQLNNFTAHVWFKSTVRTNYARLLDKNYQTGFFMGRPDAVSSNTWSAGVKQSSNFSTLSLNDALWNFMAMTRSGTSLTTYANGIINTNTTTCGSGTIDTTYLSIGATINDGGGQRDWLNGNISQVLIYNKVLSTSEILQNYNATKGRYGL